MNILIRLVFAALFFAAIGPAEAQTNTFYKFAPATGVLKGSSTSYVTTAAVAADIEGLWTGTCDATTFLRGDGACATTSGQPSVGPTGAIQYSDGAGNFLGVSALTFDGANTITLGNSSGAAIKTVAAATPTSIGDALTLTAGAGGSTSGAGGALQLNGGVATTDGSGGAVIITGADAASTGAARIGGAASLKSGAGALHGNSGTVTVSSGAGGPTGNSGTLSLLTGVGGSTNGNSGTITIATGTVTSGTIGSINLTVGALGALSVNPDAGITIGTPTGGDKGAGTVNMGGCFVNNVPCSTTTGTVTSVTAGTGLTGGTITSSGTIGLSTPVSVANGGNGTATPAIVAGTGIGVSGSWPNQTVSLSTPVSATNGGTGEAGTLTGILYGNGTSAYTVATTGQVQSAIGVLPVPDGGTGTSSPSLVSGTGISVTGSWPNQTITATGSSPIIARAHVVTDGSSSCTLSNATGIASTTWNGTSCTVTFTTSYFSITPICTATANTVAGGTQVTVKFPTTPSSSATAVAAQNVSGGAVVGATLDVICIQ